jgi:hypothetical protein
MAMAKAALTLALTLVRTRGFMRTLASVGVLAAIAAPSAQAQSAADQRAALEVFQDYAPDGAIDPCKHSSQTLKLARDNIPPDIEQYAADYPAAIAAAIDARARGDCNGKKPSAAPVIPVAPSATPTARATPIPTAIPTKKVVPDPPEPETLASVGATATAGPDRALERVATARASNDAPAPVFLLGLLAVLLALTALLLLATKRYGLGEERFAGAAHAWREARWRGAGTWQDFLDWVRLGR